VGLANGTKYDFSVRAENGSGFGEWSVPSNDPVNGVPAGPPGQVPAVNAVRLDQDTAAGGQVQVSWGTPADNGDANFTFTVSWDGAAPRVIADAGARSTVVAGLQNGRPYTFRVSARNKAGTGPAGEHVATPAAIPARTGAPLAVEGDRTVTLTVAAPDGNGAGLSRWEVGVNGGFPTPVAGPAGVPAGTPVSLTVGNLTNGSAYTFTVRACNEVGCGQPSPASNQVVPYGNPAAPQVVATVDGATITWRWTAPDNGGRPVIRYDYVLDGVPGNTTGTSVARQFLDRATHTLRVTAVNAGGRTSPSSVVSAVADPPPVPLITTGGAAKDTWDNYVGPTGRHAAEVPAGAPVTVLCKANSPLPGGGLWFRIDGFSGGWMRAPDFTEPADPRVPTC
jgi:hypothetical protein